MVKYDVYCRRHTPDRIGVPSKCPSWNYSISNRRGPGHRCRLSDEEEDERTMLCKRGIRSSTVRMSIQFWRFEVVVLGKSYRWYETIDAYTARDPKAYAAAFGARASPP